MKKSAQVTLTVLAAVGAARAQQAANPCGPSSFNPAACQAAVKFHGYCDGATWVPQQYQKYPYYYGLYRAYASAGGIVDAPLPSSCRFPIRHGGFGAHGAAFSRHAGS
jgi:hypothetical protein